MRGLIALCLVSVASAGLLPNTGYNYQQETHSSGGGGYDYTPHSSHSHGSEAAPPSRQYLAPSAGGSQSQGYNYAPPSAPVAAPNRQYLAPSGGGSHGSHGSLGLGSGLGSAGSLGAASNLQGLRRPAEGHNQVTKNFYIHSAAEDNDQDASDDSISALSGRENYNILFVKAPAQSSSSLAASLAKLQQKDKTVVYVLNKKTDASELQNALNQVKGETAKPEVFFIKYKTPQEAQHAQQQIKAQYDALGGETNVSDEGESPVSSVIGSLGSRGGSLGSIGAESVGVSNTYLPPSY